METENKKLGFFDRVIYSVQPKKYSQLAAQPMRKMISFLLILFFCLTLMDFAVPVAGFFFSVGGYDNFVVEVLPDMELKEGKLTVDDRIEIGRGTLTHILVDTSVEKITENMVDKEQYISDIIVGQENVYVYTDAVGTMEIPFSQFMGVTLDNKGLIQAKPFVYFILVVSFFTSMVTLGAEYLFSAALVAILFWGPFRLRGTQPLTFLQTFALAVYAQTVPELLVAFNHSANLISNQYLLTYISVGVTIILLINGIRGLEEKKA